MGVKFVCNTPTVTIGGAPHYMQTNASVSDSGQLVAVTHTWSNNDLSGFHGGVYVALVDGNGITIGGGASPVQTFGVSGKWLGTSNRTDTWGCQFPPNLFSEASNIVVVQQWNPQWMQSIANVVNAVAWFVAQLAQNGGQTDEGQEESDVSSVSELVKNHPAFK